MYRCISTDILPVTCRSAGAGCPLACTTDCRSASHGENYIVFFFQIAIVLVFVLTEQSAIVLVLVFVFVTKIALRHIVSDGCTGAVSTANCTTRPYRLQNMMARNACNV